MLNILVIYTVMHFHFGPFPDLIVLEFFLEFGYTLRLIFQFFFYIDMMCMQQLPFKLEQKQN